MFSVAGVHSLELEFQSYIYLPFFIYLIHLNCYFFIFLNSYFYCIYYASNILFFNAKIDRC